MEQPPEGGTTYLFLQHLFQILSGKRLFALHHFFRRSGGDNGSAVNAATGTDVDGTNTIDMGCYEYLNRAADSDGDTMTDGFEDDYGLDPTDPADANGNPDSDPYNNREKFIADTDPTNSNDWFRITAISNLPSVTVTFNSSSNRLYTLYSRTNLVEGSWTKVTNRMGAGGPDSMSGTNNVPAEFFKLQVEVP